MNRFVRLLVSGLVVAVLFGISMPAEAAGRAGITLSTSSGPAGASVTVTGAGFARDAAGTVTAGSLTVPFTTTANGVFTGAVTIPATSAATVKITATAGKRSASSEYAVTYGPASLNAGRDAAGAPVTMAARTQTTTTTTTTTAPPISADQLRFGVSTPGGPQASSELDAVAALVNESPSIVMSYKDFSQAAPIADLNAVNARGASSLVTWEPWLWSGNGANQPAYALDRITAGDFDTYIRQWGTALASWGKPVMLRFAHEMNGNWYPWAEAANGNGAGDYVAAWRHVHDVVASTGATNVQWVWAPNVPYWGSTPLTGLYPGAAYVDVVALDGYNWGTSQSWSAWTSPSALLGEGLTALRGLAPGKPIVISETASAEAGGSKATWNSDLVSYLAAQPDVTGFVWFHHNKEVDWRINSSTSSTNALKGALAARNS
ncbi:glycoside hydrolase family 26 protein [Arthrobacter sp. ISL-65]|uniref:glycoside hydrolase family 26 protein n=1 Tax=Arthrobacter sp. ISL-65 TaxID=2819112 RepID=UPI001BE85482|nr:glycosyl hydrolase [Arthrobacter sp. ISL-65]MBT2551334.1 beta-mannanase [Arthrobacter sp. ISL-65]